jgi:hypothetical protein
MIISSAINMAQKRRFLPQAHVIDSVVAHFGRTDATLLRALRPLVVKVTVRHETTSSVCQIQS